MTVARAPITHLVYLHGFRSSPQSTKARRLAAWMQAHRPDVHWWCPQLPASPRIAMQTVLEGSATWPAEQMAVIGSSLGGFYARIVAARRACRAVLLNPAAHPARDLRSHIGATTAWHSDAPFFFRPEFVAELEQLEAVLPPADPSRLFALIAQGDEVLDWREMMAFCAGAQIELIAGSDHGLSDFDAHLPDVLRFLGLTRYQ